MDYYDIDIFKGDDFTLGVSVKDDSGLPRDLTEYAIRGRIKNRYSTVSGVEFETSIDVAPSGIATLSLSSVATALMPVGQHIYDVEAYPSGEEGVTFKILRGYANIHPEITT